MKGKKRGGTGGVIKGEYKRIAGELIYVSTLDAEGGGGTQLFPDRRFAGKYSRKVD